MDAIMASRLGIDGFNCVSTEKLFYLDYDAKKSLRSLCQNSARTRGIDQDGTESTGTQIVESAARARQHGCSSRFRSPPSEPRSRLVTQFSTLLCQNSA